MLMSVIGWIVFGLIVGVIAKLLMPGPDSGGIVITTLLGIAGALLAGFLGRALGWYGPGDAAGFVTSIVGAVIILFAYRRFRKVPS
ncbi:MAG: GlsB/YeaQ/YmgE family stress response membrane protein [Betaproteobacteria bacterium]